jgi:hypothetical protein
MGHCLTDEERAYVLKKLLGRIDVLPNGCWEWHGAVNVDTGLATFVLYGTRISVVTALWEVETGSALLPGFVLLLAPGNHSPNCVSLAHREMRCLKWHFLHKTENPSTKRQTMGGRRIARCAMCNSQNNCDLLASNEGRIRGQRR